VSSSTSASKGSSMVIWIVFIMPPLILMWIILDIITHS
jgi:hypothetical protein